MISSITQLKSWFRRGLYPTEEQFSSWLDSFWHKTDDIIPISAIANLAERLNNKLDTSEREALLSEMRGIIESCDDLSERFNQIYEDLDVAAITALRDDMVSRLATLSLMEALALQSAQLLPLRMTLAFPEQITLGNEVTQRIVPTLQPTYQRPNVLFIGDDNAVSVDPGGNLAVNKVGRSRIHVIPTTNTQLYQTIEIEVVEPSIMLADDNAMLFVGDNIFIS